jgi:uncharacterized phage infection (PIP) family protein YhgE
LSSGIEPLQAAYIDIRRFSNDNEIDRFYEVYEIDPASIVEYLTPYTPSEFEDPESLSVLKSLLIRLRATRRLLLCSFLSLNAEGTTADLERWRAAVSKLNELSVSVGTFSDKIRAIFEEEQTIKTPPSPPQHSVNFERRKAQIRKMNHLSLSIRSLQAKMHSLRDESERSLEWTDDITSYGPDLMAQYEAIGTDLKQIMEEWESGKAALSTSIDKTEKRLSQFSASALSISPGLKSPTFSSYSGATLSAGSGSPSDALRALNGDYDFEEGHGNDASAKDTEKVYEAVALPPNSRARSTLTREERIKQMREERENVKQVRTVVDDNTKMLKELRTVINLRPRGRTAARASMPA